MAEEQPQTYPGRNGGTLHRGGPGRPKGSLSLKVILERELKKNGRLAATNLVKSTILNAAKGNGAALKIIFDRIDGPVAERLELTGSDGGPIRFAAELDRFYPDDSDRAVPDTGE